MSSLEIKPCTIRDITVLAEVARQSYLQHYQHFWHDHGETYANHCFNEATLAQEIQQPGSAFFLAVLHPIPVGFLKLNLNRPLPGSPERKALEVERIYLQKEAAGKGMGRALMQFSIRLAEEMGKEVIWLRAMDRSPALTFYQKSGFRLVGTQRLDLPYMKDEYRGMVIMEKLLSSGINAK